MDLKEPFTQSNPYIGVREAWIPRGKFKLIFDPLDNICHQISTPRSMR